MSWVGVGLAQMVGVAQDPKCYTFLESSQQMLLIYTEKSKIFHELSTFFEIYYIKREL